MCHCGDFTNFIVEVSLGGGVGGGFAFSSKFHLFHIITFWAHILVLLNFHAARLALELRFDPFDLLG